MPVLVPHDESVKVAWSPTNEHVAFVFPSGNVYLATPGTQETVVLDGAAASLAWSPDGALMALTSELGAWFVDTSGATVQTLETDVSAVGLGWSSDSSQFAYLAAPAGSPFEAKYADTSGADALVAGPAEQGAWSPSSPLLALYRALNKEAGIAPRVTVWSPEARDDIATNTLAAATRVNALAWSSSGERLLYQVVGGSRHEWVVADPQGAGETQRFEGLLAPAWSPVGSALATLTSVSGTATWKLELQPEAAEPILLGDGIPGLDGWAWLPAADGVAFANARGIFAADLGGAATRLKPTDGSRLRFFRPTPGVSGCPRTGGNCTSL
jgi:WD40 repeat protein